jgi:hypothetical protein
LGRANDLNRRELSDYCKTTLENIILLAYINNLLQIVMLVIWVCVVLPHKKATIVV